MIQIVKLADKWAKWIVIIVFLSSITTLLITKEVTRAVTILVVFCPCALILATPTAIIAAIGNLTKYGVLVRNGESLEKLSKIDTVIFDKTGTLTYGKPEVIRIIPYKNISEKYLIKIITSLENNSEHPLAKSIVKYYKQINKEDLWSRKNFKMIIGKGVIGTILKNNEEVNVKIGNPEFIKLANINSINSFIKDNIESYISSGNIILYVCQNNEFIGSVILSDKVRKESKVLLKKYTIKTSKLFS